MTFDYNHISVFSTLFNRPGVARGVLNRLVMEVFDKGSVFGSYGTHEADLIFEFLKKLISPGGSDKVDKNILLHFGI